MNKQKFKKIKLLVLDFDGVLTDNRMLTFSDGKEAVFCSRADGLGIEMLQKAGVKVVVISTEKNEVVQARCRKLQVECHSGIDKKIGVFLEEVKKARATKDQVCFIGNDINDLDCIKSAGIGVAVKDSYNIVLANADYVTQKKGGKGAVREVANLILGIE